MKTESLNAKPVEVGGGGSSGPAACLLQSADDVPRLPALLQRQTLFAIIARTIPTRVCRLAVFVRHTARAPVKRVSQNTKQKSPSSGCRKQPGCGHGWVHRKRKG